MPYLVTFLFTVLITYFAERNFKNNKKVAVLFSFIAILGPSILAGCRDELIGTDILVYVNHTFEAASRSNSISALIQAVELEKLYLILNYAVAKLFTDVHWIYFFVSLIPTTFIYLGLYYYKEKVSMWFGMLLYLLTFYNLSLNMVRQSMALGIVFYATRYVIERKLLKFFLLIFIAAQFHITAYFGIALLLIYILTFGKNKLIVKGLMILGMLLFIVFFNNIATFLIFGIDILPHKFAFYIAENSTGAGLHIFSPDTLYRIIIIVLYTILYKPLIRYNKMNSFIFIILIFDFLLMQLGSIAGQFSYRISYYFGYMQLLAIPQITYVFNKKSRIIVQLLLILLGLCYWYIYYIYLGYNDTYPYTSSLLGIG